MTDLTKMQEEIYMHLWYEIAYLRYLVLNTLDKNPEFAKLFDESSIESSKEMARKEILEKMSQLRNRHQKSE